MLNNARKSVVAELPNGTLARRLLTWQPIGLFLMALHVMLLRNSIWLFPIVPLVIAWLYVRSPLGGLLVFFQILIYQNIIVSFFSPGMDYSPTYVVLGGTNFAILCILSAVAFSRLTAPFWWNQMRGLIWLVLATLAMMVLYSVIGAVKAGPTSALVYFRGFSAPLLGIFVGADIGRIWGFKTVGTLFILSVILSIGMGLVEYAIPLDYYAWTHETAYYQLKYIMQPKGNTFYTPADIVSHFTNAFLNITGTGSASTGSMFSATFRFGGSIITPTSYAYVLAVVGVVAISVRRGAWLIVIFPMMFLVGAKGASLLLLFSLALFMVWQHTASKRVLVAFGALLSVGYAASGILVGLSNNDYHVVGFMGGVHSLMSTPLGHGLGVGGNMSAEANAGFKMDGPGGFTRTGADFALESAIGVLFYQTGFASVMVFAVFAALLVYAPWGRVQRVFMRPDMIIPKRQDILFFAAAMILVNGIFQEEAYSPYAAGTIMLLCSCIIGNGRREHVMYAPAVNRFFFLREARA